MLSILVTTASPIVWYTNDSQSTVQLATERSTLSELESPWDSPTSAITKMTGLNNSSLFTTELSTTDRKSTEQTTRKPQQTTHNGETGKQTGISTIHHSIIHSFAMYKNEHKLGFIELLTRMPQ